MRQLEKLIIGYFLFHQTNNAITEFVNENTFINGAPDIPSVIFLVVYIVLLPIALVIGYKSDSKQTKKEAISAEKRNEDSIYEEIDETSYLVKQNKYLVFLRYEHAWLGVIFRKADDSFTRPKRILRLFTMVILNIAISGIWFGHENNLSEKITVSVITAIIIFPTSFYLKWMFKSKYVKRIEAYIASILLIAGCLFLILLYGYFFNNNTAELWFTVAAISIVINIIIFEPILVAIRFFIIKHIVDAVKKRSMSTRRSEVKSDSSASVELNPIFK